jgi:hypothetical protein
LGELIERDGGPPALRKAFRQCYLEIVGRPIGR